MMANGMPVARIGDVTTPVERPEVPLAGTTYRQIGVRLWGIGAYERESIDGSQTRYATLSRVESGDIIVNKIWARNGSVAVVTDELAGCFGSSEFPTFAPDRKKLEPKWFHWITKTRWFWQACDEKSQGTSGKNRIRPEKFLEIEIPLPPLAEQRCIVARIEALAARVAEAQSLRREASEEADNLITATLAKIFDSNNPIAKPVSIAKSGLVLNRETRNPEKGPDIEFFYIDIAAVDNGTGSITSPQKILGQNAPSRARRVVHAEDVIISTVRPYLKAFALVPTELDNQICSTGFAVFTCPQNILPEFLLYQFFSPNFINQAMASVTGGHYPALNDKALKAINVMIPDISEQRRLVAYLDGLQAQVAQLRLLQEETQKELSALIPSILDKAFKGELLKQEDNQ